MFMFVLCGDLPRLKTGDLQIDFSESRIALFLRGKPVVKRVQNPQPLVAEELQPLLDGFLRIVRIGLSRCASQILFEERQQKVHVGEALCQDRVYFRLQLVPEHVPVGTGKQAFQFPLSLFAGMLGTAKIEEIAPDVRVDIAVAFAAEQKPVIRKLRRVAS